MELAGRRIPQEESDGPSPAAPEVEDGALSRDRTTTLRGEVANELIGAEGLSQRSVPLAPDEFPLDLGIGEPGKEAAEKTVPTLGGGVEEELRGLKMRC